MRLAQRHWAQETHASIVNWINKKSYTWHFKRRFAMPLCLMGGFIYGYFILFDVASPNMYVRGHSKYPRG